MTSSRKPPGSPLSDGAFSFDGMRDPGSGEGAGIPRIDRPIYPATDPSQGYTRQQQIDLERLFKFIRHKSNDFVVFTKGPAFRDPPFFSKPLIKVAEKTVADGSTVDILDRVVEGRQRAIVTTIGIEASDLEAYMNRKLLFWFEVGGEVVPLFDDQSTQATYYFPTDYAFGKTTCMPGSCVKPFSIWDDAGLIFLVRGRNSLKFRCKNASGGVVRIRASMTYYQYWMEKASEFTEGELQL